MWAKLIFCALICGIFLQANADSSFNLRNAWRKKIVHKPKKGKDYRSKTRNLIEHVRVTKIGAFNILQERCMFTPSYGTCKKAIKVYGYSMMTNRCSEYIYSGCGGNPNRFATQHQCRNTCVFGKTTRQEIDYYQDTTESNK